MKLFSLYGSSFCRRVRKLPEVKRSYEKHTNFVSFLVTKPPKKKKQNKIGIKKTRFNIVLKIIALNNFTPIILFFYLILP